MPINYDPQFQKAAKDLKKEPWFKDGWTIRVGEQAPGTFGGSIQLSKKNWFNEEGMGIHYETWITSEEVERGFFRFVMHVLHVDTFPGTDIPQGKLTKPFVRKHKALIESWGKWPGWGHEGFGVKTGKMAAFDCHRLLNEKTDVAKIIVEEFRRFSQFGPVIDDMLAKLLK